MSESEVSGKQTEKGATREPFMVKVGSMRLEINVEKDGRGGTRYYFNHPTERGKTGKRRPKKVHSKDRDVIKKLAEDALSDSLEDTVTLTREEFLALRDNKVRLAQMIADLEGTKMSPEVLVGQVQPTLHLLIDEGVSLTDVLASGRACHIPAKPMSVEQILGGLVPIIRDNSTEKYTWDVVNHCEPLRLRWDGLPIHKIWPFTELEKLLRDVEEGKFLTADDKQRILKRNKWTAVPQVNGREKWYSDKSLVHFFNSWRRIFIRAQALGAWPSLRPLPTELMEQPRADAPDLEALSPNDWAILLPILDRDELRYVALLLADIRAAEFDKLEPKHIIQGENGLPGRVKVPAIHEKGKKGKKSGRDVTVVPYASLLLHLAMPEGDELFSRSIATLQESIYKKGRERGIEMTHNCIRRMHDTYWYALENAFRAVSPDSSHTKKISDEYYRGAASLEDSLRVYTTFPGNTPPHLKRWIASWLDPIRQKYRGVPISNEEADEKDRAAFAVEAPPPAGKPAEATEQPGSRRSAQLQPACRPVSMDESEEPEVNSRMENGDMENADQQASSLEQKPPQPGTPADSNTTGGPAATNRQSSQQAAGELQKDSDPPTEADPLRLAQESATPEDSKKVQTNADSTSSPMQDSQGLKADQRPFAPKPSDDSVPAVNQVPRRTRYLPEKQVPPPPRKANGQIDWNAIKREFMASLIEDFPAIMIAEAWGITPTPVYRKIHSFGLEVDNAKWIRLAAQQRREILDRVNPPKRKIQRVWPWLNKARFLREMCELGAKKLAEVYGCDQTILYDHAKKLGLPQNARRRFRKEGRIPDDVLEIISKFEAEKSEAQHNETSDQDPGGNAAKNVSTEDSGKTEAAE